MMIHNGYIGIKVAQQCNLVYYKEWNKAMMKQNYWIHLIILILFSMVNMQVTVDK